MTHEVRRIVAMACVLAALFSTTSPLRAQDDPKPKPAGDGVEPAKAPEYVELWGKLGKRLEGEKEIYEFTASSSTRRRGGKRATTKIHLEFRADSKPARGPPDPDPGHRDR
jgi:hypothetical protein